ncbi:UNVERIFIED_CONTAM: hypothetical protein Scaly_2241900 [Sesamum calycinum]|uniref:Reverse transcriptase domain-containing protein n=1 Tax=Sesamum calycinum TaxID=2727403 RepID=A0AAW2MAI0_9LAMI
MSPYLFVLIMEAWHSLLRFRVHNAPSFQYHWKCKEQQILNLCFADDVLLFCKADIPSIKVIKDTLSEFAELSGLKVNPTKSQIILSRAVQHERQQILDLLEFQEGCLPVRYLGVPLISSRLTIADCKPIIDKLESRIAGWNHFNLTFAGRTQLIKSVLNTLHSYWASVFILPKGVIKILEARMRKFLWQGSTGRGYAKVAWEQQGQWNWPAIPDAEFNEFSSQLPPIHPNSPDEITWRLNSGKFSVQSAIELSSRVLIKWNGMDSYRAGIKSQDTLSFYGWRLWKNYPPWTKLGYLMEIMVVYYAMGTLRRHTNTSSSTVNTRSDAYT